MISNFLFLYCIVCDVYSEELAQYIVQSRRRLDSDGEPLLQFPDNFESIAAAMDRSDLTSAEEK